MPVIRGTETIKTINQIIILNLTILLLLLAAPEIITVAIIENITTKDLEIKQIDEDDKNYALICLKSCLFEAASF